MNEESPVIWRSIVRISHFQSENALCLNPVLRESSILLCEATTEQKLCDHKPQPPDLSRMNGTAFCCIDPGCVNTGMSKDVCQTV